MNPEGEHVSRKEVSFMVKYPDTAPLPFQYPSGWGYYYRLPDGNWAVWWPVR